MPLSLPTSFCLQVRLSLSPSSDGSDPRFVMQAYDGGRLALEGIPLPVVVDLAGLKPVEQVKALMHHDTRRPVGHIKRARVFSSRTWRSPIGFRIPAPHVGQGP
ncbi:MAG: hypothetical protein R3B90_02995 [Planctomycetaceae bacterium]